MNTLQNLRNNCQFNSIDFSFFLEIGGGFQCLNILSVLSIPTILHGKRKGNRQASPKFLNDILPKAVG